MTNFRPFLRLLLALLLGCPLFAQFSEVTATQTALRPSGGTDFLDLYQQSSSVNPMPEIMTVFDSSYSMDSLMFHPLYVNNDLQDADDYRWMEFQLTEATTVTTGQTNVYTIKAADAACTGATASYTVTVSSTGVIVTNAATTGEGCANATSVANVITITAYAGPTSNGTSPTNLANTSLTFTAQSLTANPTYKITASANNGPQNVTNYNPYTMENASGSSTAPTITYTAWTSSAMTTPATSPYPTGTYFQFTVYMAHTLSEGETTVNDLIGWSGGPGGGTWSSITSGKVYKNVTTWTIPNWSPTAANPTWLMPITVTAANSGTSITATNGAAGANVTQPNTWAAGTTTLTLTTDYKATYLPSSPGTINWTVSLAGGNTGCSAAGTISGSPTTATTSSGHAVTWTIPSYCNGTGSPQNAYVTATLNIGQGANYVAPGVVYVSTSASHPITSTLLIKPDGSTVTAADAANAAAVDGADNYSGTYAPFGSTDVRNWIRAASHVRFSLTTPKLGTTQKTYTRTIDIPIPWNVANPATTGTPVQNPLPDLTLQDQEAVTSFVNGAQVTTTYGSGLNMPFDQTYLIEKVAGCVIAADESGTALGAGTAGSPIKTAWLYGVVYRPAYINWLFTGIYGNVVGTLNNGSGTLPAQPASGGSYTTAQNTAFGSLNYLTTTNLPPSGSQFIVYDSAPAQTPVLVQGQTAPSWGMGMGTGCGTATVSVPAIGADGTQTGAFISPAPLASLYTIPTFTRFQAVKRAAITTWINNQANVYWAFRELDTTNEAGASGNNNSFNQSSSSSYWSSTVNPTANEYLGADSAWTVLNNTPGQGINSTTGNSVTGLNRIAFLFANGETPLTYAMARSLAQYSDPNSVFAGVEGTNIGQCLESFLMLFTDGIDNNGVEGVNNTNTTTPYITLANGVPSTFSAATGNAAILASKTAGNPANYPLIERTGSDWNIFTYAGMGAHMGDSTLGAGNFMAAPRTTAALGNLGNYPTGTATPDQFLPFAIPSRGTVAFTADHLITTMTVGVSLGGTYTNPQSPKANLFYAAVVGNPNVTSGNFGPTTGSTGNAANFHAFQPPTGSYTTTYNANGSATYTESSNWADGDWTRKTTDPNSYPAIGQAAPGAVYFFDGSNPTALSTAMLYAFKIAASTSSNHSSANPNVPFIGATLGNEVYVGSFYPPQTGGTIWPGDLMMFATQDVNGVLSYVDQNGNPITTLSPSTAQWDALAVMSDSTHANWTSRNLYTRYPATSPTEPGISKWPGWTSTAFTNGTDPIFTYMDPPVFPATAASVLATQQLALEFAAGGDTSLGAMPATNRDSIMGDIINSVPAAVGYTFSQVKDSLPGKLASVANPTGFNLVLVGTNQGWLHAFGEVTSNSAFKNSANVTGTLTTGAIQELWAFMPTDFLNDLEYISQKGNTHLHMVDGSPAIYFLDLPASGSSTGNGLVDSTERAVAIVSLGKGGRSYYALDIHNPFTPALLWSLVPDEWANFPSGRIDTPNGGPSLDTVQGVLKNFGFSTCVPAFGRIQFNGVLHDCVFLGGGLSSTAVDAGFTAQAPNGLGRSVIALDVYSGTVLGAVDLTAASIGGSTVGSVPGGVIPFEFILNSGMAERAYFMDYNGGLWSWGSKNTSTASGYSGFRIDTPEMTNKPTTLPSGWTGWQVRKVFQDDNNGSALGGTNNRYTTLPAPWLVSNFTGPFYKSDNEPAAVGIAMISGDRNNPLDRNYLNTTTANTTPKQHQLTVVFDRQDSRDWGLDTATGADTGIKTANMVPLTETVVTSTPTNDCSDPVFSVLTPSCTGYFLGSSATPKFGYYALLPAWNSSLQLVPKGINTPLVDNGTLFYTFFTPTSEDPCTGGTGWSFTGTIANVMAPIYDDGRSNIGLLSGGYIAGTSKPQWTGVASNFFTIGTTSVVQGGTVVTASGGTAIALQSYQTSQASAFPKTRVWRSVPTLIVPTAP
jgi:hypothetical protein